ncbi:hypothetical protein [Robertkochia sediminum]|uniref:hypothetical protein n=1 Tax=Robertkochia sediminum TaxID=2785326 RepID=UPI001931677C|nr:hypothetical protein [Robertkochia sediminum]MBL7471207.1 hypothetical protein [Robertkochia sediminum]
MNKFMALLNATLTFIGIVLIGIVFYAELPSPYSWMALILSAFTGGYLSLRVFRMIDRRGYLTTISGDNASYELDDLVPTPGSGISVLTPMALEQLYRDGKNTLGPVTVSIWGDWKGRKLNEKHQIDSVAYNSGENTLTITFTDQCVLRVKAPATIHYCNTYLKIMKAGEVSWYVSGANAAMDEYHYLNTGGQIQTRSNTSWKPKYEDLGAGMHAIYLQG